MPHITFTEDVTLDGETGPGPHYRKGYAPDVSEAIARQWIAKGVAVRGVVKFEEPKKVKAEEPVASEPEAAEPVEIPTFRRGRRR